MGSHMEVENKLGATNFRGWKTRIDRLLAKENLLGIVKGKVTEPKNHEEKLKFEKGDITARSIIMDFIKDHLIPYISNLDSSKKTYGALIVLCTINNIGQVMSLRNELRDVRMNRNDTIASYFMRISQLRDQLQAIDEVIPEKELVTITLNILLESWDSFSAGMCQKNKLQSDAGAFSSTISLHSS